MSLLDIDDATAKLQQAKSLATMLYGQSGDEFRRLSDTIQGDIQWLLASTIEEGYEALLRFLRDDEAAKQKTRDGGD